MPLKAAGATRTIAHHAPAFDVIAAVQQFLQLKYT
jgi:hypothetical protein